MTADGALESDLLAVITPFQCPYRELKPCRDIAHDFEPSRAADIQNSTAMGTVRNTVILILCISFTVFVALFGRLPIVRKTPIGFLYRVIWVQTPKALSAIDSRLTGGRVLPSLERSGHYLLSEPHPIVLVFFILLLSISELLFIPPAWARLPSPYWCHRTLTVLLPAIPYIFLYLSCTRTSAIRPANHALAMSAYPYDYTLFHPPSRPRVPSCRTCTWLKPARSKHCSLCRACVAKADHHCIWLNACVGRNNYGYFLLLLLSLSILAFYGAYLAHALLDADLQSRFVPTVLTRGSMTSKRWSTGLTWTRWVDLWGWALQRQTRIGAVGLLAAMAGPLPAGLLLYHLYLIWAGMTTNESAKWADLREDVRDGLVWRARREDVVGVEETEREEKRVRWPVRGKWIVVVTANREMPRSGGSLHGHNGHVVEAGMVGIKRERSHPIWEQVASLSEVENVYDLGFWENLRDVFMNRD